MLYVSLSAVAAIVVAVALFLGLLLFLLKGTKVSVGHDDAINVTPSQIQAIKRIGEWESLSIDDEELVDTVRHGLFGDSELVRIYYGTLRLGVDLGEARDGWIQSRGDNLVVVLPAVKLLDEHFIDEARTRSFFEKGKWTSRDRAALYQRARERMKARCLTEANLASARRNATTQFRQLLRSMGYEHVSIQFSGPHPGPTTPPRPSL